MAVSPEQQLATMLANLPEKTGKTLKQWQTIVASSELEKHGLIVKYLKTDHGVTHGFANLIAAKCLEGDDQQDLVENQYKGAKEALRPIHDAIIDYVKSLGEDIDIAPKKASVSLRRKKQFALITPATKTRIDLGLALKGEEPAERLETYNAMCSHRIRISSLKEFDATVRKWLSEAYNRAG